MYMYMYVYNTCIWTIHASNTHYRICRVEAKYSRSSSLWDLVCEEWNEEHWHETHEEDNEGHNETHSWGVEPYTTVREEGGGREAGREGGGTV